MGQSDFSLVGGAIGDAQVHMLHCPRKSSWPCIQVPQLPHSTHLQVAVGFGERTTRFQTKDFTGHHCCLQARLQRSCASGQKTLKTLQTVVKKQQLKSEIYLEGLSQCSIERTALPRPLVVIRSGPGKPNQRKVSS